MSADAVDYSRRPGWTFGDRVRKARRHAGLTQEQLAERIGTKASNIDAWEHDRNRPRRMDEVGTRIEFACGLDRGWMFGAYDDDPVVRGQFDTGWYPGEHAQQRTVHALPRGGKHGPRRLRVEVALHAHPHNHKPLALALVASPSAATVAAAEREAFIPAPRDPAHLSLAWSYTPMEAAR